MITEIAPAKVNLFLHVTGRREDGYHLLSSLVVFDDSICDYITVTPSDEFGFSLKTDNEQTRDLINPKDNLVVKAAQLLADFTKKAPRFHITLEKHLPVGGGVGGGSSDAAATLKALERYWQFLRPHDKEHEKPAAIFAKDKAFDALLLQLGADVPVCYFGQPCIMRGIGEVIEPLPYELPTYSLKLHQQSHAQSTLKMFKTFQQRGISFDQDIQSQDLPQWNTAEDMAQWLAQNSVNSFEKLTQTPFEVAPKDSLLTRMSGSGSTYFSLVSR